MRYVLCAIFEEELEFLRKRQAASAGAVAELLPPRPGSGLTASGNGVTLSARVLGQYGNEGAFASAINAFYGDKEAMRVSG